MSWIETKPPISYSAVDQLIQHIEASTEKFIDGVVLATALKFVYGLGLKKNELFSLSVGHVFDASLSPLNAIIIGPLSLGQIVITIPTSFTPTILNYLPHLQNIYGAGLGPNVPLFPNRTKVPYNDTSFSRHLDILTKNLHLSTRVNLEMIRKTGICKYYDHLKAMQATVWWMSSIRALDLTAEFARRTERHTEAILRGQIQPWGGKLRTQAVVRRQISGDDLTLRLTNNTLPSETEIMEIIGELARAYFPSLSRLEEFRTELTNAIQRNSALNEPEIIAAFHAQLEALGFGVDPDDRAIYSRDERLWDE